MGIQRPLNDARDVTAPGPVFRERNEKNTTVWQETIGWFFSSEIDGPSLARFALVIIKFLLS
jgi:hypothetical protein